MTQGLNWYQLWQCIPLPSFYILLNKTAYMGEDVSIWIELQVQSEDFSFSAFHYWTKENINQKDNFERGFAAELILEVD